MPEERYIQACTPVELAESLYWVRRHYDDGLAGPFKKGVGTRDWVLTIGDPQPSWVPATVVMG